LNKEFTEFDSIVNYQHLESLFSLYRQKMKPEGKIYLLLDEIQNIRGWEHFVNSHSQDFTEKCDIFITGSNSRMLSGRYVSFEIFPFSFEEFVGITQKQVNRQSFLDYMQSGGLPELFVLPNEETKRNYVSAVKEDRKIYVQSSYLLVDEQTIAREYEPLLSVADHYEKYVVSLDEMTLASNNGVKHVLAWELKNIIIKK
jgi:predicted AAA+ superfamily ATPase